MAVRVLLSEMQRASPTRLCTTIVPSPEAEDDPHRFWARSASALDVPEAIEEALAAMPEEAVDGMRSMLDALAAEGFDDSSQEGRENMVNRLSDSSPEGLAGIHAFKGLTTMLFYAKPDAETGRNPNWPALGYPGPRSAPPDVPKPIRVLRPSGDELTIEADVCVVGSGCGGGVIAGRLAEEGKKVAVLEGGGYYNEADFNQLELWAYQNLYLGQGPFTTAEGQVAIMAGANLGGGSTVNWMNC